MNWQEHVHAALEGKHPRLGRGVEFGLLAVVAISALLMGVETFRDLSDWVRRALGVAELAIVAIFTAEYLCRLATSPHPGRYALSFYGIIDLLSIAPFYLGIVLPWAGLDLRALRSLRLFRLFRLFKVVRYTHASERLAVAWREVKDEVMIFGIASVIVLYVCALVIYQFESEAQPQAFRSVFDAMWWAAITLTTVGYGDIYPITVPGRVFTVLMLFVALGIIAVPTGLVASAMTTLRQQARRAEERSEQAGENVRE